MADHNSVLPSATGPQRIFDVMIFDCVRESLTSLPASVEAKGTAAVTEHVAAQIARIQSVNVPVNTLPYTEFKETNHLWVDTDAQAQQVVDRIVDAMWEGLMKDTAEWAANL